MHHTAQKTTDPKLETLYIQGQLLHTAIEGLSTQIRELNKQICLLMAQTGSPLS
jgi:hypothetical protein